MSNNHRDDKLTTLLSTLPKDATAFSLEFFPPKTHAGFTNLQSRLARMTTALRPLFISVTWGAGGSTATKSLELAEICQRQLGVPTVLHLTCTNMSRKLVDEALEECREVGIRNILALRGDPPRDEYKEEEEAANTSEAPEQEFEWAVDLVRYIRKKYADYFCIGVAGYPEGHADESHPEAGKQSVDHDLPYLAEKVRAGADFIMTQLTYDVDAYRNYETNLQHYVDHDGTQDIFKNIPVIPGLMPIQSYQILKRITNLSHAKIPTNIFERIEEVKGDDNLVKKLGVDIMSEIVEEMKSMPPKTEMARVLHFYTLNLEKSVAFILERCKLIPPESEPESETTESEDSDVIVEDSKSYPDKEQRRMRRASSANAQPHNRVILTISNGESAPPANDLNKPVSSTTKQHEAKDRGSGIPAAAPSRTHNLLISEGQGSLGREATWDDFPNGRWGPSHSPAFGEIDGYGPSLKVGPITARKLWGYPIQREDVTDIFKRHVTGQLVAVPWSDDIDMEIINAGGSSSLRAETDVIRKELLNLIEKKSYLTLASQPAVDGVRSDDAVHGWGPKGEGFVFQKAFVEFFCPRFEWSALKRKLRTAGAPIEYSWLKTDAAGDFESSEIEEYHRQQQRRRQQQQQQQQQQNPHLSTRRDSRLAAPSTLLNDNHHPGTSGVNAVTWGVFRGKEIISPTIIEAESFRAWGEEAFTIWEEWRRCFPRGSVEEQCLEGLKNDMVLVNVVGQNFVGGHSGKGGGLWRVLLDEEVEEQEEERVVDINGTTTAAATAAVVVNGNGVGNGH